MLPNLAFKAPSPAVFATSLTLVWYLILNPADKSSLSLPHHRAESPAASAWDRAAPALPTLRAQGWDQLLQPGRSSAPLQFSHAKGLIKPSHDILLSADSSQGRQFHSGACSQASTAACPQTGVCPGQAPTSSPGRGRWGDGGEGCSGLCIPTGTPGTKMKPSPHCWSFQVKD